MNVSFSTRGWQDIPWEDQIRMAQTMRFGGVELYNVQNTPALTDRGGPLHKYNAAATARELWQSGLRIPCFDTSCDISGTDCTETVQTLLQTAHDVQSPYVAVTALHDDDANIRAALEVLIPAAEALGMTILLKTSVVYLNAYWSGNSSTMRSSTCGNVSEMRLSFFQTNLPVCAALS